MHEIYFTAFILLLSIIYTFNTLTLRMGNVNGPGPGFLPLGVGVGAIIMAVIVLTNSLLKMRKEKLKEQPDQDKNTPEVINNLRLFLFVLGVVIYTAVLKTVGFLAASFCLMFYLFRIMGIKGWLQQIIYSLLSAGIAYIVFALWLKVPFPQGFIR